MEPLSGSVRSYTVKSIVREGVDRCSYIVAGSGEDYFMKEYAEPVPGTAEFNAFHTNQQVLIERLNSLGSITEKIVEHFVEGKRYYQLKHLAHGINVDKFLDENEDYEKRRLLSVMITNIVRVLHENGIVHQDLKPDQIMLVEDEIGRKTALGYRVTLTDFDWAIPDGKCVHIVGTTWYKSPEHYRGVTPDAKSDIFTLGVMIYAFLAMRNPYHSDDPLTDEEIGKLVLAGKVNETPKHWNPAIPDDLDAIIMRCLDPSPANRPDIKEIARSLVGTTAPPALPKAIRGTVTMESGACKYIVEGNKDISRSIMKTFFGTLNDKDGDPIYKYCDPSVPMLIFTNASDDTFTVCSPNKTKNCFMLNGERLDATPRTVCKGDVLTLLGGTAGAVIASFDLS